MNCWPPRVKVPFSTMPWRALNAPFMRQDDGRDSPKRDQDRALEMRRSRQAVSAARLCLRECHRHDAKCQLARASMAGKADSVKQLTGQLMILEQVSTLMKASDAHLSL